MNFCFDECMPPKWFRYLAEMLKKRRDPIQACHLLDDLSSGVSDAKFVDWVRSQSPQPTVISGDSAMNRRRGEPRLPLLCPRLGVTSVFIGRKLCQKDGFEKVRMVIVCLPELIDACNGPRGKRYRLASRGTSYEIREWPLTSGAVADQPQAP